MLKNFVTFYDLGLKAIANSDAEHRVTYSLIRSTLEKDYVALTQMKFVVPPQNPKEYDSVIFAPLSALNEQIVRSYQELDS
jgi:hypothetical protein